MIWHRIRALMAGKRGAAPRVVDVGVGTGEPCPDGRDDQDENESMNDGHPWELLVRYGAGDATPEELAELSAWRGNDPERARVLHRVARLGALSREADAARHTDVAWERLEHRMRRVADGEARVLPVRRRRFETTMPTASAPAWRGRVVAGIAAAALVAISLTAWKLRPVRPTVMRDVATRRGERIELGLPDGSHVVLGADSRLRFASAEFASARTLYLDGQGYFAVAHDTRHPFVVHARGAAVQAVGTAFGVRAYPEDSTVSVAVAQGRVLMRGEDGAAGSGTVLDRGDLGEMDRAGRATVRRGASLDPYLGWVRGRLIYDAAPVEDVVRDLERWYDLSIHIDDAAKLGDLRVNMTIDPTQPAPVALQRLAEVLNRRVVQSGGKVELARPPAPATP